MIVVSGEAVRYGARGASVGRGCLPGVFRALFFLCVRVCVCFFALSC